MQQQVSSILCFDFDGTFVDPEGQVSFHGALLGHIGELKGEGAVWVINTGRSLFQVLEGLQQHGISMLPDYIIANESEVFRPGGLGRWVPFGDWNKRCASDHRKFYRATGRVFKKIRNFVETSTGATYYATEDGPSGVVAQTEEEMDMICEIIEHERRKVPMLGYQRNSKYLRFSHVRYHKGSALGELTRLLDMESQYVFAAGDNYNDVSMLDGQYAGAVACPANAVAEVKRLVSEQEGYVAERPFSEGVTEAVRYFYY